MRLSTDELADVLGVLEKIDTGSVLPQIPGLIGRFLRQYARGRASLDQELTDMAISRRADRAVSGLELGPMSFSPMLAPTVKAMDFPLGEVAETVGFSEELGGMTRLVLWLKGPTATTTFNLLQEGVATLRMDGDYRWKPLMHLTPGGAEVAKSDRAVRWREARCLKAVSDDLSRPPHALEYAADYSFGTPGLKCFRCVIARRRGSSWEVLPALGEPRMLDVEHSSREVTKNSNLPIELASLLIYREPWSDAWTIVRHCEVGPEQVVAHCITWADYRLELDGAPMEPWIVRDIRSRLREMGIEHSGIYCPNLERTLPKGVRAIVRWLRGTP